MNKLQLKEGKMLISEVGERYVSIEKLVEEKVASRIHAKDASLYEFSNEAHECAAGYMGWVDLASNPPTPLHEIQDFADTIIASGINTVVLIGQGGSTQAPMTITKYNKIDCGTVVFKTLDSDSPVRVREILTGSSPQNTLFIVSSKSGETIEPRLAFQAVRNALAETMSEEEAVKHFVAITDPGSDLEKQAIEENWRAIFLGEPSVGGRFSALSVFGLLPAALVGIELEELIAHAVYAENRCSEDSPNNPAIILAAFLYDNYCKGRDKFSFFTPKRGRVLGLWIEQLVAESLGKEGKGILPNIEIDALLASRDTGDRTAIVYETKTDLWDERKNFDMSLEYIDKAIPRLDFKIEDASELAQHFVMWEYATAMCGFLMEVCPFDQPDVSSAKEVVLDILEQGQPAPDFSESSIGTIKTGKVEVSLAPCFKEATDLKSALSLFLSSIKPKDYFALNAFLPYTGEGRREALENIRNAVGERRGVASCLEVGPRYLHSTGQLQKGGPNTGVFLILSSDEPKDIFLDSEAKSLGALAKAQAAGDLKVLASRERRCLHIHLPDNSGVTLRALSDFILHILVELKNKDDANKLTP